MRVLLEFSRGSLKTNQSSLQMIRDEILREGHILTNDLMNDYATHRDTLPEGVYERLQRAIKDAQCVVIEGSVVSLSLGYVLTEAINLGKPVLFLAKGEDLSNRNRFVGSIKSKLLIYKNYRNAEELCKALKDFLKNHNIKTRFNLVLPNYLNSYVTVQSIQQGTSKTEYIIDLIERDRKKNEQ